MKRLIMMVTVALATAVFAQDKTMSLADARGKIGDVVASPASMTEVIQQLSAADQKAYVAAVNEAISKMPGSANEKTAKYLAVNEAALKGAKKGNLTALVAEVFATVPTESLTVLNERFAKDLFSRSADPSKVYTDEQLLTISRNVMSAVRERTASSDDAEARNTFAILMMVRASEGTPANLKETLLADLKDDATRDRADKGIAAAMAEDKSYDQILDGTNAGDEPSAEIVLKLAGPQLQAALLSDLVSSSGFLKGGYTSSLNALVQHTTEPGLAQIPRTLDTRAKYNPLYQRGESTGYEGQIIDPNNP